MANAYGDIKRPRQTGPSRAHPVIDSSGEEAEVEEDLDLDDLVRDERNMTKRLHHTFPIFTLRQCYNALSAKKFHFNDTQEYLCDLSEETEETQKQSAKSWRIDLTQSEDELMPTPAQRPRPAPKIVNETRQQASKPVQSIREKYGTQAAPKPLAPKPLNHFQEPPKTRKLVRGSRNATPPPATLQSRTSRPVAIDSESDRADSGIESETDQSSSNRKLLTFFNEASVEALADTAGVTAEVATHVVSSRPFKSLSAIKTLPALVAANGRKKQSALGEKLLAKCDEMFESYEAVDYVVKKCESIAEPLVKAMNSWGVKVHGSKQGELEMTSFRSPSTSSHDSGIGTPVSDIEEERAKRPLAKFVGQPTCMPDNVQMKDYQIVGLNWLRLLYERQLSGILADDMGLGKTIQVIAFFAWLLQSGENGPHLVVVPAATLENWLQELRRFCPALTVEPYYANNPKERMEMQSNIEADRDNINVIVTTYTVAKAKTDHEWLREFGFCCIVFDEGHVLKNADSQVASKLRRIKSNFRLLLTGTPLQNNLKELISLLAFLQPAIFRDKKKELQAIFTHTGKVLDTANHAALLSAQRIVRARSMLTPFILRRKKHQVLKDLPKKEQRVEFCDMSPAQYDIYYSWIDKARDIRDRRDRGENVPTTESGNILIRLRQAAIHPFLFRRLYRDSELPKIAKACTQVGQWAQSNPNLIVTELQAYSDMEIHQLCVPHGPLQRFALSGEEYKASGKIQTMLKLLHNFISDGHRTLIFSQFVMVLDILGLVLSRENTKYFRLDGNTRVEERQVLIDEFCSEGNQTPVFLLSTKAGGAGINLAKANKVIIFDSGFNPQDDVQAENRAHRIGQTKEVEVIRLVTRGTVEEAIYEMGRVKLRLDEEVAGSGEGETGSEKETEKQEMEGRKVVEELFWKGLEKPKGGTKKASIGGQLDGAVDELLDVKDLVVKAEPEEISRSIWAQQDAVAGITKQETDLPERPRENLLANRGVVMEDDG